MSDVKTIKALYFNGQTVKLRDDYQLKRHPTEALIRVSLAGICNTDLEILRGYASFSGVPGHEFVGFVEESDDHKLRGRKVVGEINCGCGQCDFCLRGLERHCPNRTVLGIRGRDGAFATHLTLPPKNLHVVDDLDNDVAVFVEPLAAAFEILEQLHVQPDWEIAVVGDGKLGLLVSQVLSLVSPNVVCVGKHPWKLEVADRLGISTLTIEKAPKADFDLVVDATGSPAGLELCLQLVKPRGTLVMKTTVASAHSLDFSRFVVNEVTIVGSRCGRFKPAIEALRKGSVKVKPLIDSGYKLEDFEEAFKRASSGLKVLFTP